MAATAPPPSHPEPSHDEPGHPEPGHPEPGHPEPGHEPGPVWRRSSFSTGAEATCVEVAFDDPTPGDRRRDEPSAVVRTVLLRDSKDPTGPVLRFTVAEWRAFLSGVGAGEFALVDSEPVGPRHCSSATRAASSADDACGPAATRAAPSRASA